MNTQVESTLRHDISARLGIDEHEISCSSYLVEDLGADSLDVIEIVMDAEQEFAVELDEDGTLAVRTFGELVERVEMAVTTAAHQDDSRLVRFSRHHAFGDHSQSLRRSA